MKRIFHPKIKAFFLLFSVLLMVGMLPLPVNAVKRQAKVVRVGFPLMQGLSIKDEKGNLSGYTYDYLMEISQYTGWKCEFVFVDGSSNDQILMMLDMLQKGEIDLLGPMNFDETLVDTYSYPGYCYGINYSGLFVPEDSKLQEASLYNTTRLRVGVYNRAGNKSQKLEQFAQMNNLPIEQIVTQTAEDFNKMLEDGRVDAILSTDLAMSDHKNMHAIVHFSPVPFYFATTKGNTDIVQQLDYAISTIDQVDPNFMVQLYNQYFSKTSDSLLLTEMEEDYLENCGTLEVLMYDNKPPFQYIDEETKEVTGITVEILNQIAQSVGFQFHYNTVSTYQEYMDYIDSGKADIAADALINYQDAFDTQSSLTLPWYSLPMTMVFREGTEFKNEGKVAIPYFLKNVLNIADNVVYYDTVEECLQAVQEGSVEYCYAGEFCSQYFLNTSAYEDLKSLNQSDVPNQKLCFGIYNTSNISLLTIINKCITNLPKDTINEITYRNTYTQQETDIWDMIRDNRNMLIAVAMALVALVLIISFYIKNRQQQRIAFENKRYNVINNLANEYFYDYDIREDELLISEKCAEYFGCERRIEKFSKVFSSLSREEMIGIWQFGEYITGNEEGTQELSCMMQDGTRQWFKILSSIVYNRKQQVHAVGKITNIQKMKTEQIRLKQQASLDGLTGIYNIATVKKLIQERLEKFDKYSPCALLILDVDNFKQVNDSFGHIKGDEVLIQAASMITGAFPDGLAGRLGGDEFVVFVTNMQQNELEEQCRLLCKKMILKTEMLLGTSFSWSIGISWAKSGQSYDELYKETDAAMYKTKTGEKNGYSFFGSLQLN